MKPILSAISKFTPAFYLCIVISLLAIIIFFQHLSLLVIPFPYHDEFDHVIPILAKWGEGTFTLQDIWAQQGPARFPLSSLAYIALAEIFGEDFYGIGIYLVYAIISLVSLFMIFRARSSTTEMLAWTGILLVVFMPRAVQVHFWLYANLDVLHLFLLIVIFSSVKLTASRKSGVIYALLFALALSYRISILIVPFFMLYHLLQHLADIERKPVSVWHKLRASITSFDGFMLAGLGYIILTGLYFIGYHSTPLPAKPSQPAEFLLNLTGGAFLDQVPDVKLLGIFFIVIIAWLSRNRKTIIISLGVLLVFSMITATRSGLGEEYAFQNRYYIYSSSLFVVLIILLENISNILASRVLQWSCLAMLMAFFSYWTNSGYAAGFIGGKQIAYNEYLKNNLFNTANIRYLHPDFDDQMYKNFMLALKHGYFHKPSESAEYDNSRALSISVSYLSEKKEFSWHFGPYLREQGIYYVSINNQPFREIAASGSAPNSENLVLPLSLRVKYLDFKGWRTISPELLLESKQPEANGIIQLNWKNS
jgi:hypothetical protein